MILAQASVPDRVSCTLRLSTPMPSPASLEALRQHETEQKLLLNQLQHPRRPAVSEHAHHELPRLQQHGHHTAEEKAQLLVQDGAKLQGTLFIRGASCFAPCAITEATADASSRCGAATDAAGRSSGGGGISDGTRARGEQEVEVEANIAVDRGRILQQVQLQQTDEPASTAAQVAQLFPFAQQNISWLGRDVQVKVGLISCFRRIWGQLAVSIEGAAGLKIPSSHSNIPIFCACRVDVDGRHVDTARVRSTLVTSEDIAAQEAATAAAASADNWRAQEAQAKAGPKAAAKSAVPILPGAKAMWKTNMMLGISDVCLNPSKDPRVEAALGLRLTVLLYTSDGHSTPSALALVAGGVGGGGTLGLGTQSSTQEEGVVLGSVCVSLGELARKPRGGPIETVFSLASAGSSAAGVIQVRLWAQQSGLEGGRCVQVDKLTCRERARAKR
jgi:hypothetical protein